MTASGSFEKTKSFLRKLSEDDRYRVLDSCAKQGVMALATATPVDTGLTSRSWDYRIESTAGTTKIVWTNSNQTSQGDSIAIMLQYGHGTGTGGYVMGTDYINPAIKPVFDNIAMEVWKLVTEA